MVTEFLAALRAASDDNAAAALSAALKASYESTPRDGVAAGLAALAPKPATAEPAAAAPIVLEPPQLADEEAA